MVQSITFLCAWALTSGLGTEKRKSKRNLSESGIELAHASLFLFFLWWHTHEETWWIACAHTKRSAAAQEKCTRKFLNFLFYIILGSTNLLIREWWKRKCTGPPINLSYCRRLSGPVEGTSCRYAPHSLVPHNLSSFHLLSFVSMCGTYKRMCRAKRLAAGARGLWFIHEAAATLFFLIFGVMTRPTQVQRILAWSWKSKDKRKVTDWPHANTPTRKQRTNNWACRVYGQSVPHTFSVSQHP